MASRTVFVPDDLAGWWRQHAAATGMGTSGVAVAALEPLREEHPTPTFGSLPVVPFGQRNAPRRSDGRTRLFIGIPDDLHEWLRVYCAVTGRSGDAVITEALTEYRSRVESTEPCTQH